LGRWRRAALAIFVKEMREGLRDRRTLIAAVVLPAVIMPVVVLAMPALAKRQETALLQRPARIAVEGGDASGLAAAGFDEHVFSLVSTPAPRDALRRGEIDAVLLDAGMPGPPRYVVVLYDQTRAASRAAVEKVTRTAAKLALRDLQAAARARGLDPEQVIPVVLEPRAVVASNPLGGGVLAVALPFFLAVWLLLGGQYAALDVGVGEYERGSLDALLVSPPSRAAIVTGKFLAVLVPALFAALVMVASSVASASAGARFLPDQPAAGLSLSMAGRLLVVGIALGALLSSVQLLLSLGSRTLREAQQAFTGLYLIVALPIMLVPLLGEWDDRPWLPLVPVVNAGLAYRDILSGREEGTHLALTACILLAATIPMLALGARVLGRQRVPNR
jgi:sodium transport system permease protein